MVLSGIVVCVNLFLPDALADSPSVHLRANDSFFGGHVLGCGRLPLQGEESLLLVAIFANLPHLLYGIPVSKIRRKVRESLAEGVHRYFLGRSGVGDNTLGHLCPTPAGQHHEGESAGFVADCMGWVHGSV